VSLNNASYELTTGGSLAVASGAAAAAACCTCFSSIDSGPAPTNSTDSPTTVLGTDETRYRCARSGNPVTSTPSAVMGSLSIAKRKARRTARGQCGQVGVEKTWMCTGWRSSPRAARVSAVRPLSPEETSRIASTSVPNS
jgi:hypothetical protein